MVIADSTIYDIEELKQKPPGSWPLEVYTLLEEKIQCDTYPCVGAKAAWNNQQIRVGLYESMGGASTGSLASYLKDYITEACRIENEFMTLIAIFRDQPDSEDQFETLLWQQLQALHDLEKDDTSWASGVSANPESPDFSFSFNSTAFFIVGMNPYASRLSRRFPYPALVFNLHDQFENLRKSDRYERMKEVIRQRDIALQGSINPMLADFGQSSEARQYSGVNVGSDWKCPFRP